MSRASSLMAAAVIAALALAPAVADARAGGGGSFGSRGGFTYSAPPVTRTAPYAAAPMDRSMTPRPSPGYANPAYGQPSYGRGGFASGLLGGLLGAGIGGLLFGHGLFGGGGFGFIGFLLQMAILFFIGRWLFRTFLGGRPAMATGPGMSNFARMGTSASPMAMGGGSAQRSTTISPADYQAFEQLLHEVQAAWSTRDMRRLQSLATPEMVGYFGEQLSEQASRGVVNTVTDVRLEQGDLSQAWSEGNREYSTVAMRFSTVDVTRDSSGRVVDGDPNARSMATELWTFVRAPGGRWLLSAIQQAR